MNITIPRNFISSIFPFQRTSLFHISVIPWTTRKSQGNLSPWTGASSAFRGSGKTTPALTNCPLLPPPRYSASCFIPLQIRQTHQHPREKPHQIKIPKYKFYFSSQSKKSWLRHQPFPGNKSPHGGDWESKVFQHQLAINLQGKLALHMSLLQAKYTLNII